MLKWLLFPPLGNLPDPGVKPIVLAWQADSLRLSHLESPTKYTIYPCPLYNDAPLRVSISKQEYWSGLPFLPLGDLPDPGIKPGSPAAPALQADSLPLSHRRRSHF